MGKINLILRTYKCQLTQATKAIILFLMFFSLNFRPFRDIAEVHGQGFESRSSLNYFQALISEVLELCI